MIHVSFRRLPCLLLVAWLSGCAVQTAALQAAPGLPNSVELHATPFFPQTDHRCGPAALATALGAIGITAQPATLADEVFLPAREGTLQTEMLAGARRHGAVATLIPATLEAALREVAAGHVVVLFQNLGLSFVPLWHYAVLVGYDVEAGEVWLRSGRTQREALRMRTLEHTWARSGFWAFVALPPGEWPVTAQPAAVVEAALGFERNGAPAQALRVYETALQRVPGDLTLMVGLGNTAYAAGDKPRAAEAFRAAAERHGSGAAWVNLATVLMELGRRDEALSAARHALGDPTWGARASELSNQPTSLP